MQVSRSVGLVTAQKAVFDEPITLSCGTILPYYELVYETYGKLNSDASNAILVCHALSGNHHVAGRYSVDDKSPGWWDNMIGPGKPIDTDKFFVIGLNNLGAAMAPPGHRRLIRPPDYLMVRISRWSWCATGWKLKKGWQIV